MGICPTRGIFQEKRWNDINHLAWVTVVKVTHARAHLSRISITVNEYLSDEDSRMKNASSHPKDSHAKISFLRAIRVTRGKFEILKELYGRESDSAEGSKGKGKIFVFSMIINSSLRLGFPRLYLTQMNGFTREGPTALSISLSLFGLERNGQLAGKCNHMLEPHARSGCNPSTDDIPLSLSLGKGDPLQFVVRHHHYGAIQHFLYLSFTQCSLFTHPREEGIKLVYFLVAIRHDLRRKARGGNRSIIRPYNRLFCRTSSSSSFQSWVMNNLKKRPCKPSRR